MSMSMSRSRSRRLAYSLCAFLALAYSSLLICLPLLADLHQRRFEGEAAPSKAPSGGPSATTDVGEGATFCGRGEVLDFAGDGGRYECRRERPSSRDRYEYEARHDRLPAREILLLDRPIGSVARICEGGLDRGEDPASRCLLPTPNRTAGADVNSPMPVRVRSWMDHSSFRGQSMVLYYSSHTGSDGIRALSLDSSTRRWKESEAGLSFGRHPCRTLHSPSIFVSDERERFYMYVHGHNCKDRPRGLKRDFQPTLLFVSEDGVAWEHQEGRARNPPYLLWRLFYLSNPIHNKHDGYFYVMAKIREGESVVLCRAASAEGPFQEGPRLGRSIRHFDLFDVGEEMYVLFSLYGDRPERILLGSIDTSSSANWTDWKLLPGPRILKPEYWYEHGNAAVVRSRPGMAQSRHRISDPRILLDVDGSNSTSISGLMFYSARGERGIATARISIHLGLYRDATSYRDRANVRPDVLESSSLARGDEGRGGQTSMKVTPLLVTGVGRTGTTSGCTLLQNLGINVSHDNDVDCGPYPGPDGAISWYDAFDQGKRYGTVIHMVRDPLKTLNSRIAKCKQMRNLKWLIRQTGPHEAYSHDDTCHSFAIKNWVRRNSFVGLHASWRTQAERLFSEPLSAWELCMAAGFGDRCPELSVIETHLKSTPSNLNSLYVGATVSKFQETRNNTANLTEAGHTSWESLANSLGKEDEKYIRIARTMAQGYGYDSSGEFDPSDFYCEFTAKGTAKGREKDSDWDCFIADPG